MSDDDLHVEPASLRHVGRQLNQGAEEGREAFSKQHSQLTAAAAGLFDRSRSALESKADAWRTRAAELTDRVDVHGTHLHTSAALYESTDGENRTAIHHVGDAPSLNLKA
ncbi:MAG: type VII secretion target [Gordonia paraffinivorans]